MEVTATASASASVSDALTQNPNACTTCIANLDSKEAKRAHMRDDWHVYNLKRRIASLEPISAIVFQEQVLASKADIDGAEALSSFQKSCIPCEQHYTSRKAWQAHLKSRNHLEKSSPLKSKGPLPPGDGSSIGARVDEDDAEIEEEEVTFNSLQCLFCSVESISLDFNLAHMSLAHSFFIPDIEYLIDVESLLGYLYIVISVFHECLFCGSERSTMSGAQDHMRGKGHCKVDFEDDGHQLQQFYDFSGDLDCEEDVEQKEIFLVPDDDELRLPSGKILGHRSFARIFRQHHLNRLPATASQQQLLTGAESVAEPLSELAPAESRDRSVAMRAGSSTSLAGVPQLQQRALLAVEHHMMKQETAAKKEYQHVLERGGNKQKRFKVKSMGKKQGGLEKRLG
ncbi:Core trichothecene cluster (CTC) protein [Lachnellula suecica]|uniref:Core trichothecene cluster (CTC) protein n=1 Tax=Lachnellula suecica TaxID=602035 RepID=A0A8T9CC78_9HELO|nr:Core trichothecene cluster (CTC) protein [Lachnellula suecica]